MRDRDWLARIVQHYSTYDGPLDLFIFGSQPHMAHNCRDRDWLARIVQHYSTYDGPLDLFIFGSQPHMAHNCT